MDKETYLVALEKEIALQGYGKYYSTKCTRYALRLIDNNLPVVFDTKHLSLLIGIKAPELTKMVFLEDLYYTTNQIPKKSGGYRELDMPAVELKYIQRWILKNILCHINISGCAVGFCPEKSIVTNAQKHINKHCIVNMDIKDFFPSISFERVYRIFSYYGYTNEVSFVLAKLCTFHGRLPQGSPASPYLSNISCLKLDARLNALSEKYESDYSRYADDITFSSRNDIKSIIKVVNKIIIDEGFDLNTQKTRTAYPNQRQEVTGLIVNGDSVRVPQKYKRELRQEIYYCQKYGVSGHMNKIGCHKAYYKEHLYGKIYFVNMVEPEEAKKLFEMADKIQWDY